MMVLLGLLLVFGCLLVVFRRGSLESGYHHDICRPFRRIVQLYLEFFLPAAVPCIISNASHGVNIELDVCLPLSRIPRLVRQKLHSESELLASPVLPDRFYFLPTFNALPDHLGAVDSLVFYPMTEKDPSLSEKVRVVWTSEAFGPPAIVVPTNLDGGLKSALRQALLSLHKTNEGSEVLASMGIERFRPPREADYDSAYALFTLVREQR